MNVKSCDFRHRKGLHLAHLNIRSLWNKIDVVRQLIKESGIHMFSLSETWLNTAMNTSMIDIPGYSCIRLDRAWTENNTIKKGSGICCYYQNEILEAIHDKDRLLAKAKQSNSQADWIIARRRRNEVKNLTKHAKSNFIKDNLNQYKNDSKKFWNSLSDILPSESKEKSHKIFLKIITMKIF